MTRIVKKMFCLVCDKSLLKWGNRPIDYRNSNDVIKHWFNVTYKIEHITINDNLIYDILSTSEYKKKSNSIFKIYEYDKLNEDNQFKEVTGEELEIIIDKILDE